MAEEPLLPNPDSPKVSRRRPAVRVLIGLSLFAGVGTVLFGILLYFLLPRIIGNDSFRIFVADRATEILGREIALDGLSFSWQEGMRITRIRIADDPRYGEGSFFSLGLLDADIDFSFGPPKRVGLRLNLLRPVLQVRVAKDGSTSLDSLLERFATGESEPASTASPDDAGGSPVDLRTLSIELPLDLMARIEVERPELHLIEDRQNLDMLIGGEGILVDIPSLLSEPLLIDAKLEPVLNGAPLHHLHTRLQIDNLGRRYTLFPARADIRLLFEGPGITATVDGNVAKQGVNARWELDLTSIHHAARAFLPPDTPGVEGFLSGGVGLQLSDQSLGFAFEQRGRELVVSSIPDLPGTLGPLSFALSQKGELHLADERLDLHKGEFHLLDGTSAVWTGSVADIQGNPAVALTIGPVVSDLGELMRLVTPLLSSTPLPELQGANVEIRQIRVAGTPLAGEASIDLEGESLTLSGVRLHDPGIDLRLERMLQSIDLLHISLRDMAPTSLSLASGLSFNGIDIRQGEDLVGVKGIEFALATELPSLNQNPDAILGITAAGDLRVSGELAAVELASGADRVSLGRIGIEQRMGLFVETAGVGVHDFAFSAVIPNIDLAAGTGERLRTGLNARLALARLSLPELDPDRAAIRGIEGGITTSAGISGDMKGDILRGGFDGVTLKGGWGIEPGRLAGTSTGIIPPDVALQGRILGDWSLAATRPTDTQLTHLMDPSLDLPGLNRLLGFIREIKGNVRLADVALTQGGGDDLLAVEHISGEKLIAFTLKGTDGVDINFEGGLQGDLSAIPGLHLTGPLPFTLTYGGRMEQLEKGGMHGGIELASLPLAATGGLSFGGLRKLPPLHDLAATDPLRLVGRLPLSGEGGLDLQLGKGYADFLPDMELSGSVSAHGEVSLLPGRELKLGYQVDVTDLSGQGPDALLIDRFNLNLNEERNIPILSGTSREVAPPLLSESVMTRGGIEGTGVSASHPLALLLDRQGEGRPVAMRFARIESAAVGPRVRIDDGAFDLRLIEELPESRLFRMNLLGGSVAGSWSLTHREGEFWFLCDLAYSGLETTRLLAQELQQDAKESRLSGSMRLEIPLRSDPLALVEGLKMDLGVHEIGRRTLEQALYALDPEEADPSIVEQRKLLGLGRPTRIAVQIDHGNLAMQGEVIAAGIPVNLPPVKRLNLAALPIRRELEPALAPLKDLLPLLERMRTQYLIVDPDGVLQPRPKTSEGG